MSVIALESVDKKFGSHRVLYDFSLKVESGEMVAIRGNSGAGKSTLLNIIGLLEEPDGGEVYLNGCKSPNINSKKASLLQRNVIGYLFQNYALIDTMTVSKNLDIALQYVKAKDKEERKESALLKVGLQDKMQAKVYTLSGGEQQRVAIARLLLKPCEIILADEPTGSLDADNKKVILDLLLDLHRQGKTILIVTHDEEVANACQRVVVL